MISTIELLQEFELVTGLDHTGADEEIAHLYTGIRLISIVNKYKITTKIYDEICEDIVNQYLKEGISLDNMINGVYNYINYNKKRPPKELLNDKLNEFLEDYANNEEYNE